MPSNDSPNKPGEAARAAAAASGKDSEAKNKEASDNSKKDENPQVAAISDDDIKKFTFSSSGGSGPASTLYYPSSLQSAKSNTSYVMFSFFEYIGPYTSEGQGSGSTALNRYNANLYESKRKKVTDSTGTLQDIALYMPEDLQAQYGAQWGGKAIQNVTSTVLKSIGAAGGLNPQQLFETIMNRAGEIESDLLVKAISSGIDALQKTGQAEGLGNNDILGLTRGVVLNPNTELLFAGFDLRTFSLNFKMVARSQAETDTIRNIITTFKKAMLPSSNAEGLFGDSTTSFIKVPALVDVKFKVGASEHPYVTQFKPCAITGLNVNYTPDGSYAVYDNFAPVAITLQIQFSETKLVYREEINWGGASY